MPAPDQPRAPDQANNRNRLLRLMATEDYARLAPLLAAVPLSNGLVLAEPNQPIAHVYFLETGVSSTIAVSPENHQVEAGLTGREGLVPVSPVLGSDRGPNRITIQIAGEGWRIERLALEAALEASGSLRGQLTRFVHSFMVQVAYTALSNAVHSLDERLARWLLMCDDRTDGEIALTHDFMSIMLAVRRPSVTTTLHVLEGNGFISTERGVVSIRNRPALEEFAGDAYGKPEAEYQRVMGSRSL